MATPVEPNQPEQGIENLEEALAALPNPELLAGLDLVLLELEKRLLRYAQRGAEIQEMADEGLVLAARAAARLAQAVSSAHHAQSHLQLVGIGGWQPRSTRPGWSDDPRVAGDEGEEE
jgi:hypothetical protein